MLGVVFAIAYEFATTLVVPSAASVTLTRTTPVARDSNVPTDITAALRTSVARWSSSGALRSGSSAAGTTSSRRAR